MAELARILQRAVEDGASDIHIQAHVPVSFRIHGRLTFTGDPLDEETATEVIYQALPSEKRQVFEADGDLDVSYEMPGVGRFRINVHRQQGLVGAAVRVIPSTSPDLASLNLPWVISEVPNYTNGLVLVTGATGSGKSTTLAALLARINATRPSRIVTVEDPVEFRHVSEQSLITQRDVGSDTASFAEALRRALRQDPDVIMVGELRDRESMRVALQAAGTGHLVLASMHSTSAKDTVNRIIDTFPGDEQNAVRSHLSQCLRLITSQILVPSSVPGQTRVVASEVLVVNPAARALIKEGKTHQLTSVTQAGYASGMVTLDRSLADLVRAGLVTLDDALSRAVDPDDFQQALNAAPVNGVPKNGVPGNGSRVPSEPVPQRYWNPTGAGSSI